MTLTTDILTLALRSIAAKVTLAAGYQRQALARRGDVRNLTLGTMVDKLADEGAIAAETFAQVLDLAGAHEASAQVTQGWGAAARTLHGLGLECRMASMQTWITAREAA